MLPELPFGLIAYSEKFKPVTVMNLDMSFLPDGKSGNWSVSTFTVQPQELSQTISFLKTGRSVPAGTYKKLVRNGTVVMSNTPDEIRDFYWHLKEVSGSVIINGLGLGCTVKFLLSNPAITKLTVIEKSEDVIALVAPHYNDSRLAIIHADAFEYQPPKGETYDYAWHDIWDYICADNLPEMAKLHRKYGKRVKAQHSWAKELCQRYQ